MELKKQVFADFVVTQFVATKFNSWEGLVVSPMPRRLIVLETVYAEHPDSVEVLHGSVEEATKSYLTQPYAMIHEDRGYYRSRTTGAMKREKRQNWQSDVAVATGVIVGYLEHALVHTTINGGMPMIDELFRELASRERGRSVTDYVLEVSGGKLSSGWASDLDWANEDYFLQAETYEDYVHRWKSAARKLLAHRDS